MQTSNHSRSKCIHVGIVGAGLSGLRCADILLQHGCKVTIFEARNRIGGRVAQSRHLGHLVDLGPNWIHGTVGNPIHDIAKTIGSKLHDWDEEQAMYDPDGHLLDPDDAAEYGEMLWDENFIAGAFDYSRNNQKSIDPQRSLYDFFVEQADKMFLNESSPAVAKKKREMFLRTTEVWGGWVGSPIQRQSLKFFWMEECIDGDNLYVADTYQGILEVVGKRAVEGADIRLECEVTSILSKKEEDSERLRPRIELSDGTTTAFDAVVVTTPLGWLKHNQTAFQPALPPRLSQAIGNIGYGTLDKVYIAFPSAFWDEPLTPSPSLPNGLDTENKAHSIPASTMAHYPSVSVFLNPSYAPTTNPQKTYQECIALSALPQPLAHPTLLFYIFGSTSRHIASLISCAKTKSAADSSVLDFFHPYFSLLPNYNASSTACQPVSVLSTAWANDKFAGYGSYSNFSAGAECADEDMEVLRKGLPERGVWLAGEHTAPIEHTGTTSGAYLSGEKVAERIVEAFGVDGRSV